MRAWTEPTHKMWTPRAGRAAAPAGKESRPPPASRVHEGTPRRPYTPRCTQVLLRLRRRRASHWPGGRSPSPSSTPPPLCASYVHPLSPSLPSLSLTHRCGCKVSPPSSSSSSSPFFLFYSENFPLVLFLSDRKFPYEKLSFPFSFNFLK
jgi:hypothetical protein